MRCEALAHPKICGERATHIIITGTKKASTTVFFCERHLLERVLNFVSRYDSVIVARYEP